VAKPIAGNAEKPYHPMLLEGVVCFGMKARSRSTKEERNREMPAVFFSRRKSVGIISQCGGQRRMPSP
jgi:hypothetical protein